MGVIASPFNDMKQDSKKETKIVIEKDLIRLTSYLFEIKQSLELLILFVRRDFAIQYRQTLLGPAWYLVQPIISTFIFTFFMYRVAKVNTGEIPPVLFYLTGVIFWNFFSESTVKIANTFKDNQSLFSKVYFPHLIMPLSNLISSCIKLGIQLLLLMTVFFIYFIRFDFHISFNFIWGIPVAIVGLGCTALAIGLNIAAVSVKNRDLLFVVGFFIQILMFISPVLYPVSALPDDIWVPWNYNPLSVIFEFLRWSIYGGNFELGWLAVCLMFIVAVSIGSIYNFLKSAQTFVDIV